MPSKKPTIIFVMDPEELADVDDYRFQHRFSSRAAAIKWLLRWAVKQNPDPKQVDEDRH